MVARAGARADDRQPCVVECTLGGASGASHVCEERIPVVTGKDPHSNVQYWRGRVVACVMLESRGRATGRDIMTVDIGWSWGPGS